MPRHDDDDYQFLIIRLALRENLIQKQKILKIR